MTDNIKPDLQSLAGQIAEWQRVTFGAGKFRRGPLVHLAKEVAELTRSVENVDALDGFPGIQADAREQAMEELADVFHLMVQVASDLGATPQDIADAVARKLEINRQRKWKAPDASGVVEHEAGK